MLLALPLAALLLLLACPPSVDAKPAHAVQMDAIDACLFTCDACYKVGLMGAHVQLHVLGHLVAYLLAIVWEVAYKAQFRKKGELLPLPWFSCAPCRQLPQRKSWPFKKKNY